MVMITASEDELVARFDKLCKMTFESFKELYFEPLCIFKISSSSTVCLYSERVQTCQLKIKKIGINVKTRGASRVLKSA